MGRLVLHRILLLAVLVLFAHPVLAGKYGCDLADQCDEGQAYAAAWEHANENYTGGQYAPFVLRLSTSFKACRSSNGTTCQVVFGSGDIYNFVSLCSDRSDEHGWAADTGGSGAVCYQGCFYEGILDLSTGQHWYSATGATCTPTEDTPEPESDRDGDGVPDHLDEFPDDPNEWKDSDGDGVGDNADHSPDDPTDGKDDGSGDESDNTASGGGDCSAPPQCSGDGIACATLYQTWRLNCNSATVTGDPTVCNAAYSCTGNNYQCAQVALLRKTACSDLISGNVDTDGDGFGIGDSANLQAIRDAVTGDGDGVDNVEVPWVDGNGEMQEWSSGLGGGTCPAPISRTVTIAGHSAPIELSFQPICDFSLLLQAVVISMSAVLSGFIIAGVRK